MTTCLIENTDRWYIAVKYYFILRIMKHIFMKYYTLSHVEDFLRGLLLPVHKILGANYTTTINIKDLPLIHLSHTFLMDDRPGERLRLCLSKHNLTTADRQKVVARY